MEASTRNSALWENLCTVGALFAMELLHRGHSFMLPMFTSCLTSRLPLFNSPTSLYVRTLIDVDNLDSCIRTTVQYFINPIYIKRVWPVQNLWSPDGKKNYPQVLHSWKTGSTLHAIIAWVRNEHPRMWIINWILWNFIYTVLTLIAVSIYEVETTASTFWLRSRHVNGPLIHPMTH